MENAAREAGPQGCAVEGEREAEKADEEDRGGQAGEEAQMDEGEEDIGKEEDGRRIADPAGTVEEEAEQREEKAGDGVGDSASMVCEGKSSFC